MKETKDLRNKRKHVYVLGDGMKFNPNKLDS